MRSRFLVSAVLLTSQHAFASKQSFTCNVAAGGPHFFASFSSGSFSEQPKTISVEMGADKAVEFSIDGSANVIDGFWTSAKRLWIRLRKNDVNNPGRYEVFVIKTVSTDGDSYVGKLLWSGNESKISCSRR